ncbi:MAG: hypothetical protein J0H68_09010 [Sphingobacteriia bacterium]|nr:hypothetical protein [Sphingobacteriia bacterium]
MILSEHDKNAKTTAKEYNEIYDLIDEEQNETFLRLMENPVFIQNVIEVNNWGLFRKIIITKNLLLFQKVFEYCKTYIPDKLKDFLKKETNYIYYPYDGIEVDDYTRYVYYTPLKLACCKAQNEMVLEIINFHGLSEESFSEAIKECVTYNNFSTFILLLNKGKYYLTPEIYYQKIINAETLKLSYGYNYNNECFNFIFNTLITRFEKDIKNYHLTNNPITTRINFTFNSPYKGIARFANILSIVKDRDRLHLLVKVIDNNSLIDVSKNKSLLEYISKNYPKDFINFICSICKEFENRKSEFVDKKEIKEYNILKANFIENLNSHQSIKNIFQPNAFTVTNDLKVNLIINENLSSNLTDKNVDEQIAFIQKFFKEDKLNNSYRHKIKNKDTCCIFI